MIFNLSKTPQVLFGAGSSLQVGEKASEFGCRKVICITDEGVKKAGITDRVIKTLKAAKIETILYDKSLPDAPDYIVEECAKIAKDEEVDGVLGVGGGSSLDVAKGVNVLLGNPSPITRYHDKSIKLKPGKTLMLIPTTSGTGSEVSTVAVVTDTKSNKKSGVLGESCISALSIIDPELVVDLPPSITAATGMDALSHVVEAYTSSMANPYSDMRAEKAIILVKQYLPVAVKNGSNITARTFMCFSAMLGGMNLNDAMPHLGHAIAHTMGAKLHISHGIACAIALPEAVEYVSDAVPEKIKFIGEVMGLKLDKITAKEMGKKVAEAIRSFSKELGVPTLKELKIEKAALEAVAAEVLNDDCAPFVPKEITADEILKLLHNAYDL